MTRPCSLCSSHATQPFAISGINGSVCDKHAEALAETVTRFVRIEMQSQRRASRALEAELVPKTFRRSA